MTNPSSAIHSFFAIELEQRSVPSELVGLKNFTKLRTATGVPIQQHPSKVHMVRKADHAVDTASLHQIRFVAEIQSPFESQVEQLVPKNEQAVPQ